jgi:hypothetical protein
VNEDWEALANRGQPVGPEALALQVESALAVRVRHRRLFGAAGVAGVVALLTGGSIALAGGSGDDLHTVAPITAEPTVPLTPVDRASHDSTATSGESTTSAASFTTVASTPTVPLSTTTPTIVVAADVFEDAHAAWVACVVEHAHAKPDDLGPPPKECGPMPVPGNDNDETTSTSVEDEDDDEDNPSATAPGHDENGNPSDTAPGQDDDGDGNPSATAPGPDDDGDGNPSNTAPGDDDDNSGPGAGNSGAGGGNPGPGGGDD